MADDACDHGEVLPSLKGECLCAAVARLGGEGAYFRAELEKVMRERDDWIVVGKVVNRLSGVISRIAGTLGLDPDESEEEEVEERAKALRALVTQLVGALSGLLHGNLTMPYSDEAIDAVEAARAALAAADKFP